MAAISHLQGKILSKKSISYTGWCVPLNTTSWPLHVFSSSSLLGELIVALCAAAQSSLRTGVETVQNASALLGSLPHNAPARSLVSHYCRWGRGSVSRRSNENQTRSVHQTTAATTAAQLKQNQMACFERDSHELYATLLEKK